MTIYPCITLWQPWASLIAYGAKPFEFRRWCAPKRLWGQRIAIHARKRPVVAREVWYLKWAISQSPGARARFQWATGLIEELALPVLDAAERGDLPTSSVLCICTLGEPIRNEALAKALGFEDGAVNDSTRIEETNWGWPFTGVVRLKPFRPSRGRQGIWNWVDDQS